MQRNLLAHIPEDRKVRLKAATINQRFCTAEEVAKAEYWLASESPACINGEVIDMNNGSSFR